MAAACAGSRPRIAPKTLEAGPRTASGSCSAARTGRCSWSIRADGSGLRQIRLATGSGRYFAYQPAWSPDGTRIVLRLILASTGEQHLYTMRPTGSDLQQVANTQGSEEIAFADWGPHPRASSKG